MPCPGNGGRKISGIFARESFLNYTIEMCIRDRIEKEHEERYKALAANIENGRVFARETEQVWQCRNCGFVYIGLHAPEKCPVCAHPKAYFELKSSNY